MKEGRLAEGAPIPLLCEPDGSPPAGAAALAAWVGQHHDWIAGRLREHGALLFRGLPVGSPEAFEAFARAIAPEPMSYQGGLTPRRAVAGAVVTSTEAPPFLPIPLHGEMSYLDRVPTRVLFCCEVAPRHGGETPIADLAAVHDDLDASLRARFGARGLRLIENVPGRRRPLSPRSWRDRFGTDDRAAVERACRDRGIDAQWRPSDLLRMVSVRPAVRRHPDSGRPVWFNALLNHDSFSWELRRCGRPLIAAVAERLERRRARLPLDDRPGHCTYADGAEIPRHEVEQVRRALWEHAVLFPWRRGDVLLLDNLRVAHGRMPFRGPRRILAYLGAPCVLT